MKTLESKQAINSLNLADIGHPLEERIADLKKAKDYLEKIYYSNSPSANAACDYTSILVIVDKVKEFANKRQFYQLGNAIEHALFEIEKFHEANPEKGYILNKDIFESLDKGIDKLSESFQTLYDSFSALCFSLKVSSGYIIFNDEKSLEMWTENLEIFGDALEDNIQFFSIDMLQKIQVWMLSIIEESRKKLTENNARINKKDGYKIRIRNAAGFISRLIDYVIEESDLEEEEILDVISKANHSAFFEE